MFVLGCFAFPVLSALAQGQDVATEAPPAPVKMRLSMAVPDAPRPVSAVPVESPTSVTETSSADWSERTILLSSSKSKYSTVLKPGQERIPYTVEEKFLFSLRESVSPEQAFVVTLSAGYNHLIDGNPHFGSDEEGFGEREGSAALREFSVHLLGDGLFASAFHQDPRYFRQGYGVPFKKRVQHVFVSAVTSHADSDGRLQPDYSGLLGRAVTAGETIGYYPHVSANGRVAAETFGYSILGGLGGNAFLEFWPDILHRHAHE
jgi:hypothetical protein